MELSHKISLLISNYSLICQQVIQLNINHRPASGDIGLQNYDDKSTVFQKELAEKPLNWCSGGPTVANMMGGSSMVSSISLPVNLCNLVILALCLYAAGIIRIASSLFPVLMISQALWSPSMHPHSTLVTKWVLDERKDCIDRKHEASSPPFFISIRNFPINIFFMMKLRSLLKSGINILGINTLFNK